MDNAKQWRDRRWLAAMLLFAACYGSPALAVDCTPNASGVDKVVCSDHGLLDDDAKLNEDYGAALKRLSPEAQSLLRTDQRHWLRYRGAACGFASDGRQGNLHCLVRQFVRRDNALWSIGHQQAPSPYVFFMRAMYEIIPGPVQAPPFWSESSIPQIDHQPTSMGTAWADEKKWNTLMAKLLGGPEKTSVCEGGMGDIHEDAHVTGASVLLISVSVDRDDQCRYPRPPAYLLQLGRFAGLPTQDHFMSETHYNVVMMRGDVHQLVPSDLFLRGDGWKRLFTTRLEQEVRKQADEHGENMQPSVDAMRKVATEPSNWVFSGDAFRIHVNQAAFSNDELTGGFTVTIPWDELQGVLSFKGKRILNAPNW
jgi:uncharacterized protein YecT (DUF1311 family)